MSYDTRPRRYRFSLQGQSWFDWRAARRLRRQNQTQELYRCSRWDDLCLERIIDPENLLLALEELERGGGVAPGPDGISFRDLGKRQRGAFCRRVNQLIREGIYRPGPAREVRVPKSKGGYRTLKIRNLIDRTVSKALSTALTPLLDTQMQNCSFGFRPDRSLHQLLAECLRCLKQTNRTVILTDDVQTAFDCVPLQQLMEVLTQYIPNLPVLELTQILLQGNEGGERTRGIDQGDPLSPLCLNVLLDHVLDRPFLTAFPDIPYWRYVDDLTCACQNVSEAHRVLQFIHTQLHTLGMTLKGEQHPVPLRRQGARVQLLGFQLSFSDRQDPVLRISNRSWKKLRDALTELHSGIINPIRVEDICRGWIQAQGPALEVTQEEFTRTLHTLLHSLSQTGFRGMVSEAMLITEMERSKERWRTLAHP
ncbi:MAG: reverse transcriptase domain-containing protein [Gemmataceae bacterium]